MVRFFVREFTRIFANLKPIRADLRRLADSFGAYEKPPRLTVVTPHFVGENLFFNYIILYVYSPCFVAFAGNSLYENVTARNEAVSSLK